MLLHWNEVLHYTIVSIATVGQSGTLAYAATTTEDGDRSLISAVIFHRTAAFYLGLELFRQHRSVDLGFDLNNTVDLRLADRCYRLNRRV
ncbi:unnamed protein product [Lactuca virosa]|uniref:Uncharacterized protein n=1 Tax=Lactuca virosa TaxID=75947 RepID=A0AAU9LNU0_9ASTR|nr:unnamed protein product [Lactuca virosa]